MYYRSGVRFNFIPPISAESNNATNINQIRRHPTNNTNYRRPHFANSRINNPYIHSWNDKNMAFGYSSFMNLMPYGFQSSNNQKVANESRTVPTHQASQNNTKYFRLPLRKPFNNYKRNKTGVNISKSKAKILKRSKMQRLNAAKRRKTNAQSFEQQNYFKHNPTRKRNARKAKWKRINVKCNKTRDVSSRPIPSEKPNISDTTTSAALVSAWLTNNFETPFSHKMNHRSHSVDTIDHQCTDAVVPLYAAGCPSDLRNVEHGATSYTLPDNISMWSGMESCSLIESQELQHSKPNDFGKLLTTENLLQLEKDELVALVLSLQKQVLSDNNRVCRVSNISTTQTNLPNSERSLAINPCDTNSSSEPCISGTSVKTDPEPDCVENSSLPEDSPVKTETIANESGIKQETPSLC